MGVERFPGNFRVGVLNQRVDGVMVEDGKLAEPKVSLLCLLSGRQKFQLGAQEFAMDATQSPAALLFQTDAALPVRFLENQGNPLIKTAVSMSPDWMQVIGVGRMPSLISGAGPLAYRAWKPGSALVALARELVENEAKITRMALGLDLFNGALDDLRRRADDHALVMQHAKHYISQNLHRQISSKDVAAACGVGLRTFQRLFSHYEGVGLGTYLRAARTNAGRDAIERLGLSISEAAYRVGYSSPENFATAIKKAFGVAPSHFRQRDERIGE
ncbi:helix-turn-helix transcriptional regulator [Tritonibacter mobilis]|uniref:helix-turn-helix transcriptional regulator n=1 Tax=Tritonibacter mobilis TaxID=379347 RepID=UPI001402A44E|nr:AraC family transcriptional regulator [Tritonibacter mobilis]NHM20951.1 helix-turn-helix transcriptional regulator [Tritonibacter mobilis]NHM24960.1 helix-turn-helix transcriptional regulator [Tritonibacter mobilis]